MEMLKDILTNENFIPKRHNQKFASRANQIRFNNIKSREKRMAKAFIDKPMDRNRTILKNILANNKEVVVTKEYMLGAGFDFSLYTHFKVIDKIKNITEVYLYELGFTKNGNDKIKIFKHE